MLVLPGWYAHRKVAAPGILKRDYARALVGRRKMAQTSAAVALALMPFFGAPLPSLTPDIARALAPELHMRADIRAVPLNVYNPSVPCGLQTYRRAFVLATPDGLVLPLKPGIVCASSGFSESAGQTEGYKRRVRLDPKRLKLIGEYVNDAPLGDPSQWWPGGRISPPALWDEELYEYICATTVAFLTSGTSYTIPADWSASTNKIECVGPGGSGVTGGTGTSGLGGGGAGGGAYANISNQAETQSASISIQIGAGGSANDTWFQTTGTVLAKAGTSGSNNTGGTGGQAASCVGTVKNNGGTSGNGGGANNIRGASAGSGAGGPSGVGTSGRGVSSGASAAGGGGGGASNGGATGTTGTTSAGGDGGDGLVGSGHGVGSSNAANAGGNATAGTGAGAGGGFGDTTQASAGGNGSSDLLFDATHGLGGGPGGGAGTNVAAGTAGAGGTNAATGYGAGGAGGGAETVASGGTGGAGTAGINGLIVLTYTPMSAFLANRGMFNGMNIGSGSIRG